MDIVAHRGASHLAPENTLAAMRLAWELQADAAECDVHLTADGRIVTIHDPDTRRTGTESLKVAESTYERLRRLDVGRYKAERYAGQRIPLLSEILSDLPEGKRLLVEVKCGPEILPGLERVLAASGKTDQVIVISFHLQVVVGAKKRLPRVPALLLKKSGRELTGGYRAHDPGLIAAAREHGLDGLGLHHGGVTADFARAARRAGLRLFVWTVDDPAEARRLRALGIDGLITNRPGWMREQLRPSGR